eukprot:TRINITY_DN18185_c0_g1_i1.p1 TRINITY_DN18185_c0_g1~~TRINITY_DN18185_c0_g1_i1.p1  ORF type:complete len:1354 (+),score=313.68 TRINITY_DN18185_c0_g1_i1:64-4125(+)
MSITMTSCPLCGENVEQIEEHVEAAHASCLCKACWICSLKTETETRCMECGLIIGTMVKSEPVYDADEPAIVEEAGQPISKKVVKVGVVGQTTSTLVGSKQPVQCSYCRQWFHNRDANIIHQVIVHGMLHCQFCEEVFATETEKQEHNERLHAVFSCEQCADRFSSYIDLLRHRASLHKMFGCNYCDYMFTSGDISSHHVKTHRIVAKSITFDPEVYYQSRLDLFSTCTEKSKFKCELCVKVLRTSKLINHIKYFHNFSNFSLIESFASTAVNFSFNDNTLSLEPKACSLADPTSMSSISLPQLSPQDEYPCSKCDVVYADSGAHFLFQHGMARCRTPSCDTFFEDENLRQLHEAAQHSQGFSCSVCNKILPSQYGLVLHRHEAHHMQTCIFCDSMILTSLEPFANHLAQHHYIKNNKLVTNAKLTPVILRLINLPLIKFDKATQKVECCLCESSKFDCFHGGEEFVRHLMDFHHIKHPARIVFPMFDGKNFSYQSLKNSGDEISNEPVTAVQKSEKREIRKRIPKRKNNLAVKQPQVMSNQCILCAKGFSSSEEVQRHLLADHVNVGASGSNSSQQNSNKEDALHDKETMKQESETIHLEPVIKIETDGDESIISDNVEEIDIEIDEEHYSINHVEVNISEQESDPLEETDYCPIIDESIYILDEEEFDEKEETLQDIDDANYKEDFQLVNMPDSDVESPVAETKEAPEIIGDIGKSPVYLTCEVCGVILTSILNFTTHMKKLHKDSDQEKNKPFNCDICSQGFYFQSSLNSHKSKAHQETSGQTFRCPLCTSVTNSKNGMRRHLRNSHKRTDLLNDELSYKCKICNKLFWSIAERTVHIAENHKEASENLEKCFICFHISPNRHALRRHFQRMHPKEPLFENVSFKCGDCGLLYPQRQLLSTHIKAEHPKAITYQCAYCPQQLKNKKSLQSHVNQHKKANIKDQDITYTCNMCEKDFLTKKALKTHFTSSHSDKAKKGFLCKVCNKVLESANDRSLHYKVDHPDSNPYLCSICGLGFVTKSSLYNHRMCHKNQKQHKCEHCGKEFNRRDSFNEHVLIHIGPRHKCPHCAKEFVQKSNLKRHVRIHLGIKPYKCKFCEMTFSDKGACNSHQRTHTGEEREACPICKVVFSKKQKLKYHMRIHTGEGLETCHICNKIFTHSYALNVHLRTHSKENNFMCHQCKKIFQNGTKLYKHVLTHGKPKLECDQCNKSFRFSKLLNRHVMTVHEGIEGLKCSFEQCNIVSKKLTGIREHIREAHSVKNPVFGNHFTDAYNDNPSLDKDIYDADEIDLAQIYEGLDIQIDNDVLGKPQSERIKIKIRGKKEKNKVDDDNEEDEDDKDVKEEPLDDDYFTQ